MKIRGIIFSVLLAFMFCSDVETRRLTENLFYLPIPEAILNAIQDPEQRSLLSEVF